MREATTSATLPPDCRGDVTGYLTLATMTQCPHHVRQDKPSFLRCQALDLSNDKLTYPQYPVGS